MNGGNGNMTKPLEVEGINRYRDAPRAADWTVDQKWDAYTDREHDRWRRLYARQCEVLTGRAAPAFLAGLSRLSIEDGIPHMGILSDQLESLTGWRIVPVAELVPDEVFFDHLAHRRFPAGAFIRPEHRFDYLEEPDVFHDVFGHVPLLADPVFADFMQAYGQGGLRAAGRGQLANLARLYWYTVEFGLLDTPDGLRLFGAGLLSSPREAIHALDDPAPNRLAFDLERVMQTDYLIDDVQQTYFVIGGFDALRAACAEDFAALYDRLRERAPIPPHETRPGDRVIRRGGLQETGPSQAGRGR